MIESPTTAYFLGNAVGLAIGLFVAFSFYRATTKYYEKEIRNSKLKRKEVKKW